MNALSEWRLKVQSAYEGKCTLHLSLVGRVGAGVGTQDGNVPKDSGQRNGTYQNPDRAEMLCSAVCVHDLTMH